MDLGNEKTVLLDLLLSYNSGLSVVRTHDISRRTGLNLMNIEQELQKLAKEHIMRRVALGAYAFNVDIGGLRSYVLSKEPMSAARSASPYSRTVTVEEIVNSVWEPDVPRSEAAKKEAMRETLRENREALRKRMEELEKRDKAESLITGDGDLDEVDEEEEDRDIADLDDEEEDLTADLFPADDDDNTFAADDENMFAADDDEDLFPEDEEEDPILKMIREDLLRGIGMDPSEGEDEDEEEDEGGGIPVERVDEKEDPDEDLFPDVEELKKVAEELKQAASKEEKRTPVISEAEAKAIKSMEESLIAQAKKRLSMMEKSMEPIKKLAELLRSPIGQFASKLGGTVFQEGNGLKVVLPDEYFPLRAVNITMEEGLLHMNDGGLLEKFFMEGELKTDESRILFCLAARDIVRRDGKFYLDASDYMEPVYALEKWKEALGAVRSGNESAYDARLHKWEKYEELFHEMLSEKDTDYKEGAITYLYKKTSELMNKDIAAAMLYVDIRVFIKSLSNDEYDDIREIALAC